MGKKLLWARFTLEISEVQGDYRPAIWPIKYPFWCSGEGGEKFIMVAYVESESELLQQWPEAQDIESCEVKEVVFTSRFTRPEWYKGPGIDGEGKRTETEEV